MATQSSFKQQCPSCEAMVPIKDTKLIGKKVDCPKCKYRFTVEEPADEVEPEDFDEEEVKPAPSKKGAAAKAGVTAVAGKGKPGVKGVAKPGDKAGAKKPIKKKGEGNSNNLYLALAGLAVVLLGVGLWLFVFKKDGEDDGNKNANNTGNNNRPGVSGAAGASGVSGGPGPVVNPKGDDKDVDITNLIPNDASTVGVVNVSGNPSFFPSTLASVLFQGGNSFDKEAFKARYGFDLEQIQQMVVAANPKHKWVFSVLRTVKSAELDKDKLTNLLGLKPGPKSQQLGFDYFISEGALDELSTLLFKGLQAKPTAVHLYDKNTLVLADVEPMELFLSKKRQPEFLTKPEPAGGTVKPPMAQMGAAGAMGGMAAMGGTLTPPMSAMGMPPMGASGMPPMSATGMPPMSAMGKPPMGTTPPTPKPTVTGSFLTAKPILKRALDNLNYRQRVLSVAMESADTDIDPLAALAALLGKQEALAGLEALQSLKVIERPSAGGLSLGVFSEDRASVGLFLELDKTKDAQAIDQAVQAGAPLALSALEKKYALKIGYSANAMGGAGAIGMTGGQAGMMGMMGGQVGMGQVGMMGGQVGMMGGSGDTGGQPTINQSLLETNLSGKMFTASLDVKLSDHASIYDAIKLQLSEQVAGLKSRTMMVYHRSYRNELAAALKKYAERGNFPRGTLDRGANKAFGLPYPPNQRIAWTADLLKTIGGGYAELPIDTKKSWNEGGNRAIAGTAIPYFLAPDEPRGSYPPESWRFELPGQPSPFMATHYVGVAGIGLDAAEYPSDNPATAKLLGVFGYDRVTKLTDIKDGPENTIAVLQVPPTFKACWLAGGGATVRGVSEADPLTAFVCTQHKGVPGTFAIMCDGKVRFLKADMNPDTFKALCTIAGGEKIDKLDEIAPLVGTETVLKPAPELPKPKPVDPPKPPESTSFNSADLTKAFEENETTAKTKYPETVTVNIMGIVQTTGVQMPGVGEGIVLKGHTGRTDVFCFGFPEDRKIRELVQEGQTVTVSGNCVGLRAKSVLLKNCKLIEVKTSPPADLPKPTEEEAKNKTILEGTWQVVGGAESGDVFDKEKSIKDDYQYLFRGTHLLITKKGKPRNEFVITLDPGGMKGAIDLRHKSGQFEGGKCHGIYLLEGDLLKICIASKMREDTPDKRPTMLKTSNDKEKNGAGSLLFELKRKP